MRSLRKKDSGMYEYCLLVVVNGTEVRFRMARVQWCSCFLFSGSAISHKSLKFLTGNSNWFEFRAERCTA